MRFLFVVLALLGLGVSILWGLFVQSRACAFGGGADGRSCPAYRWPWQFDGEDFLLIGLPQLLFAGLLLWSILHLSKRS